MNPDQMRARFHEATAQAGAIRAKAAPLRAKRDALEAQIAPLRAEQDRLAEQVRALESPKAGDSLFDLDQERAMLVRALKGQTGPAPGKTA